MNKINKIQTALLCACTLLTATACEDESNQVAETPFAPYVLSLGITSQKVTTYYVVTTNDLMNGTISAVGNGIEQNGFRDYEQGNQTIFSVGGLGVTAATGMVRSADGYLVEKDNFAFNNSLNVFTQIDQHSMMALEMPAKKEAGDSFTFYTVDIDNIAITQQVSTPIAPLDNLEWPSITGLCYSEGLVYVTYFHMSPTDYATNYTDTTYVAVYNYPQMTLNTIMKDTRTGPAGSWYAHNGIFKVEGGDMYIMSSSSISNGYSQSTKNAAFLRIPKGQTTFDDYYFDFETVSGGLKPAHIKYLGNGLVFAEVSTIHPQTTANRWGDKEVKCCIIDLNNKTVRDIEQIPVHNGNGGRRFAVLEQDGYVYCPIRDNSTWETHIYRIDPLTATAVKGAKVLASFVGGFFALYE